MCVRVCMCICMSAWTGGDIKVCCGSVSSCLMKTLRVCFWVTVGTYTARSLQRRDNDGLSRPRFSRCLTSSLSLCILLTNHGNMIF